MRRKLLRGIARLTCRLPYTVAFFAMILSGASIYWMFHLKLQTDVLELLPESPAVLEYRTELKQFGSFEYSLVLLENRTPNGSPQLLIDAAEILARNLADRRYVFDINYKYKVDLRGQYVSAPAAAAKDAREDGAPAAESRRKAAWFNLVDPEGQNIYPPLAGAEQELWFVNLLSRADWDWTENERLSRGDDFMPRVLDRLTTGHIRTSMQRVRDRLLSSAVNGASDEAIGEDPLGLTGTIWSRMSHSLGPIRADNIHQGYFFNLRRRPADKPSVDSTLMLMMVLKPTRPSSDLLFTREYMRFLRDTRAHLRQRHPKFDEERLAVDFLGAHAEMQDNAADVRRDIEIALATSFILILGFFVIVFRRVSAVFFVGVPLLLGVCWTLGFAALVYGRVTAITCAFTAVLMGLSIDFAIHLYNRFAHEMAQRRDLRQALETALTESGEGIITSALTTAVAFFGISLSAFRGFQELGVVAGAGILFCLVSMLLVLPSLIVIRESLRGRPARYRPRPSALRRVTVMVESYPRLVLLLGLVITAYFAFHAARIRFDDDLGALKQPTRKYRLDLERARRHFDLPSCQISAVVESDDLERALQKNDALYRTLEREKDRFNLVAYDSLRTLFPSVKSQQESHERVKALRLDRLDVLLRAEAERAGLRSAAFRPLWNRLDRWRDFARRGLVLEWGDGLSDVLIAKVQDYVHHDGATYRVLTNIYPRDPEWRKGLPPEFAVTLERAVGPVAFSGASILSRELEAVLLRDLAVVVGIVALGIFLILLVHFRRVRLAVIAMVPLFCSVIWLLGSLQLLGLRLNFMNIIIIPMVIGLGIDDGIHILQRYYEQGERNVRAAIEHTGRAVVMSSLTTMLSFGTLILAQFRGVREMGQLCVLGVGFALLASLLLLPALLYVTGGRLHLLSLIGADEGVSE